MKRNSIGFRLSIQPTHYEGLTLLAVARMSHIQSRIPGSAPDFGKRCSQFLSKTTSGPSHRKLSKEIHSRPKVLAKRSERVWTTESRLKISRINSARTTTNTHKICKHHWMVPLEKCTRLPNETGGISINAEYAYGRGGKEAG